MNVGSSIRPPHQLIAPALSMLKRRCTILPLPSRQVETVPSRSHLDDDDPAIIITAATKLGAVFFASSIRTHLITFSSSSFVPINLLLYLGVMVAHPPNWP